MGSVMELDLMMVQEEMARSVEKRFRQSPERLYSQIVNLLLSDAPEDADGCQSGPGSGGK